MGIDADARSAAYFSWDAASGAVTQIICDPEGHNEWRLRGVVDTACVA